MLYLGFAAPSGVGSFLTDALNTVSNAEKKARELAADLQRKKDTAERLAREAVTRAQQEAAALAARARAEAEAAKQRAEAELAAARKAAEDAARGALPGGNGAPPPPDQGEVPWLESKVVRGVGAVAIGLLVWKLVRGRSTPRANPVWWF